MQAAAAVAPKVRGEKSDVAAFPAGIETASDSGTYGLAKAFKEDQRGYKYARAIPKRKSSGVKRKGPSPYNLFVKEMSPKIRKENPGLKQKEVMALIGKEWKKQNP